MPERSFREMIEDAGFRDFSVLQRSPNHRSKSPGSAVYYFPSVSRFLILLMVILWGLVIWGIVTLCPLHRTRRPFSWKCTET